MVGFFSWLLISTFFKLVFGLWEACIEYTGKRVNHEQAAAGGWEACGWLTEYREQEW